MIYPFYIDNFMREYAFTRIPVIVFEHIVNVFFIPKNVFEDCGNSKQYPVNVSEISVNGSGQTENDFGIS
jgi:hypothetical protein